MRTWPAPGPEEVFRIEHILAKFMPFHIFLQNSTQASRQEYKDQRPSLLHASPENNSSIALPPDLNNQSPAHHLHPFIFLPTRQKSPTMAPLATILPWNSLAEKVRALIATDPAIAEENPCLIARHLSDNDKPWHNNSLITTLSSSTPLYKSKKFWAIGGVLLAIIIIEAVCAGGASGKADPSQEADYSDSGSDGKLSAWRHKKRQEARKRKVDLATWEAYERARENETEAKLEAVQDTTRKEIRKKARDREQGLYNTEW